MLADGSSADVPVFLGKYIQRGDSLTILSDGKSALIERPTQARKSLNLLHAAIGYVAHPKVNDNGKEVFARAQILDVLDGPSVLFISTDAIRRYFYQLGTDARSALYARLGVPECASPSDLRTAWRIRQLEFGTDACKTSEQAQVERAFNVLSHADLRTCYDALRRDEDALPVFPYDGFGSILVEGNLAGDAFFANRILAYKPEMHSRRTSLLLRSCEFLPDRVVCRDPRRKLEVSLDASMLSGTDWDLTWNKWKHWLKSRIDVDATFVRTGKYQLRNGEWILRTWLTALPSRICIAVPESLPTDIERAKTIHALLGEHAEVVKKIRAEVQQQPIEHTQIQEWFDRLGVSTRLEPQHTTWHPDNDPYYFDQLRKRAATWFLFREEYLFALAGVLISEIPQPGHATYVFKKPWDVHAFMRRYSGVTREELRHNQNNVAGDLGFVGRVVRGRKRKRWLNDVLRLAGEKTDYLEVLE